MSNEIPAWTWYVARALVVSITAHFIKICKFIEFIYRSRHQEEEAGAVVNHNYRGNVTQTHVGNPSVSLPAPQAAAIVEEEIVEDAAAIVEEEMVEEMLEVITEEPTGSFTSSRV